MGGALISLADAPPSTTPVIASEVGTWQFADSNEVIALDIPYSTYGAFLVPGRFRPRVDVSSRVAVSATNQQYYKEAITAGVAAALGVAQDAIYVNDFQMSASGTTLIYFDIALPAVSSSSIPVMFSQVSSLFTACNGAGVSPVGCPAGSSSLLVTKLQSFGLPITNAYYNQQG